MHSPSAGELLRAWETGCEGPALQRAAAVLSLADRAAQPSALLDLPLGRRNRLLLDLHARLRGRRLDSEAWCPACSQRLDLSMSVEQLMVPPGETPEDGVAVRHGAHTFRFRLPSTRDVLRAIEGELGDDARRGLLAACLIEADVTELAAVPDELLDRVSEALQQADPQADMSIELRCPECGHAWESMLDLVDYLWRELEQQYTRVLLENDLLARTYHWSDPEILALPPTRRAMYLRMVQA
jgi:hypothetical protein